MPLSTTLVFSPYAWAKLLFWANAFDHEISGMGITHPDDPLLILDVAIVKQQSSTCLTTFDTDAYADFVLKYCDPDGPFKLKPANCQRIWIHSHPQGCAGPSGRDETTFSDAFGACDWSVMAILPKAGSLYARMHVKAGASSLDVPMTHKIAWNLPFPAADHEAWEKEVLDNVQVQSYYSGPTIIPNSPAGAVRHVYTPLVPAPSPTHPINRPPVNLAPAPFRNDRVIVMPPRDVPLDKRRTSRQERRAQRRQAAVQEIDDTRKLRHGTSAKLYSDSEWARTPKQAPDTILALERAGYESVYMGDGGVLFQVKIDGKYETVTFEDAWLHKEDADTLMESLGGIEFAIALQCDAKSRAEGQLVGFAGPTQQWEEKAEHKYVLRAIELTPAPGVVGSDFIFLTDTELEAINSVASGKLTTDEALLALPDYRDLPPSEVTTQISVVDDDAQLTQHALELMMDDTQTITLQEQDHVRTE